MKETLIFNKELNLIERKNAIALIWNTFDNEFQVLFLTTATTNNMFGFTFTHTFIRIHNKEYLQQSTLIFLSAPLKTHDSQKSKSQTRNAETTQTKLQ